MNTPMNTTASPESTPLNSPFKPPLPQQPGEPSYYCNLHGSACSAVINAATRFHDGLLVVLTADMASALRLETELNFYLGQQTDYHLLPFPDWETLPYDVFSPHQEIISQRLETLFKLPDTHKGILLLPISTLMQRLPPSSFLKQTSFVFDVGDTLDFDTMRSRLTEGGYRCVNQVMEHGEFAIRGSILDLFPTGSHQPIRIDLFDQDIESIRTFDPDTQLTQKKIESFRLLPAREFPITDTAIADFRTHYRDYFEGDPQRGLIYNEISKGNLPSGIEYYLPLFYPSTSLLFEYLPSSSLFFIMEGCFEAAEQFWQDIDNRYEQRRHDIERPLLAPDQLYIDIEEIQQHLTQYRQIVLCKNTQNPNTDKTIVHFATQAPPPLLLSEKSTQHANQLVEFLNHFQGRVLIAAETEGRREMILDSLREHAIHPKLLATWRDFYQHSDKLAITVAPIDEGLLIEAPPLAIIAERQLFGERVQQRRRRKTSSRDADAIVRNLTDLHIGAPVVHQDHGVGRYLGLQTLTVSDIETEFLILEYGDATTLYVPVSSLHLISRYTGASPEHAPLHKLGSDRWQKAKRKAIQKAHDVAAELLDIYARREVSQGHAFTINSSDYQTFTASFPFEETPDQESAITTVISDMQSERPMDRMVCGDVGFGKTEVAMRATFIAVSDAKQVAILVPTTLLAQQHYQNFCDRFADWPVRVELLSRFRTKKQQDQSLDALKKGQIDIVIGTHKLLQASVVFKHLGLVIVDEEHRFGVRQKEKIKSLATEIDILTLTATPIPRTLNMALAGLRDLSIIATPPAQRLAVKTFVNAWNNALIKEACQREIKRGGQIYFLHNDVSSIARIAQDLDQLIPEAEVKFAHGQMRESELEQVMLDFYHQRFNLLVCTTIIESGIDVPSANTIIINRADKLGLAQLHQLRGRVGRSHHRAYAYLLVPDRQAMTIDAIKRLEAIESLEDLGAGFMLANHDLEIRGAGELLGDEQSGQIHEVGFGLYTELLERAVKAIKAGKQPELDRPLDHGTEVDLNIQALLPEDYLPDVHNRLITYKRIASCQNPAELRELQVEMIDRFGLLPDAAKHLIQITELKIKATPLGIKKIEMNPAGGRILFNAEPNIDPMTIITLIQNQSRTYRLDGQDKLRIQKPMPEPNDRLKLSHQLLDTLSVAASKT